MHLLEGAKISQQLLKQALADPNFTFGLEAEFFIAGAKSQFAEHMAQYGTTNHEGGEYFVKKLGDLDWHDVVHFLTPLGIGQAEIRDNHEIMADRVLDVYQEVTGEEPSLAPAAAWNALKQERRVHELLAMVRAFPSGRLVGVESSQSEAIEDIVYDGDVEEIAPFGKLNEVEVALGDPNSMDEDYRREVMFGLIAEDISNQLGVTVVPVMDSEKGKTASGGYQTWFVTTESSLSKTEERADAIGVELVSAVMSASEGLEMLDRVLDMMNGKIVGLSVVTTEDTGLHVNLGVRGKQIDPVKILVLSGDEHIVKQFGREANANAASIQQAIRGRMQAAAQGKASTVLTPRDMVSTASTILKGIKSNPKDLQRAVEVLNSLKPEGKQHSISFDKLDSGYVEYRAVGNKDYHKRGGDIRNAILHMIGITYIATEPDAYRQEFLKKLYSMVQQALSHELKPGEFVDVPMADSASMIGRQAGNPGGYNEPLSQYRDTPYDGENFVQYGFDPGSNTQ